MNKGCPACGSPRVAHAFVAAGVAFERCAACRSLFDPSPPDAAELSDLYEGEEYFVKRANDAEDTGLWGYPDDYLADRSNSEAKFDRVLSHLERYVDPGRIVDVGCGPGFLLTAAKQRGWEAIGVDFNRWAADYGADELGVDIRVGDLFAQAFPDGAFDALTMMDVIEHVPEPRALLDEVARVVRPGGAIALLTPDAGAPLSRLMRGRWPEVQRPGEHAVLYSADGLGRLLAGSGFVACGWHSIGKIASLATLAADVEAAAPAVVGPMRRWLGGHQAGERVVDFDPRTKFCIYARRLPDAHRHPAHDPVRIPKRPERMETVETAIIEELESLGGARRYCDWMFEQFSAYVRGDVAEIGAGIGTFTERILDHDVESVLLVEPDPPCAEVLDGRFRDESRVSLAREFLPDAPSLKEASFDLVVCQNVLEHIGDDQGALEAMRRALRPGGHLALLVPAEAQLYGPLDEAYGHWRRYVRDDLEAVVRSSGFEIVRLDPVNALGIAGWWAKNLTPGARIGSGSLTAYEALLPLWRRVESRWRPRHGLSLVCIARA